jgi:hypothetical protein
MRPLLPWLLLSTCTLATLPAQRTLATVYGNRPNERFGLLLRAAGDVDADGHPDWIGATDNANGLAPATDVRVVSGKDGSTIHDVPAPPANTTFGFAASGIGDIDKDGHADFAISDARGRALHLYSGKTGAKITTLPGDTGSGATGTDLCALGDLDGDGHGDFAYVDEGTATKTIVISGKGLTRLYTVPAGTGTNSLRQFAGHLRAIGDLDGDGSLDFVVSAPEQYVGSALGVVRVYSGKAGALLRQIPNPAPTQTNTPYFGSWVGPAGDVDADGTPDFLVCSSTELSPATGLVGAVRIYSGKTWAVLRDLRPSTVYNEQRYGWQAGSAGDLDGDGFPDLAIGSYSIVPSVTRVQVLSGRTGLALLDIVGAVDASFGMALEPLGDADGDGFPDLLVASPGDTVTMINQGSVQVLSGRLLAAAREVGEPCGQGPLLPTLHASRPLIGQASTILAQSAPLGVSGFLLASLAPDLPVSLGVPGCALHVAPATFVILHTVPGSAATWSTGLPVPPFRQFMGLELALQAVYAPTQGPVGADLTNGVRLRLGY